MHRVVRPDYIRVLASGEELAITGESKNGKSWKLQGSSRTTHILKSEEGKKWERLQQAEGCNFSLSRVTVPFLMDCIRHHEATGTALEPETLDKLIGLAPAIDAQAAPMRDFLQDRYWDLVSVVHAFWDSGLDRDRLHATLRKAVKGYVESRQVKPQGQGLMEKMSRRPWGDANLVSPDFSNWGVTDGIQERNKGHFPEKLQLLLLRASTTSDELEDPGYLLESPAVDEQLGEVWTALSGTLGYIRQQERSFGAFGTQKPAKYHP